MFARRTLLQLTPRLAIGVGALFLVGVLLAAIPNHHVPVLAGASAQANADTQVVNPATVPATRVDEAKSHEKDAVQGASQTQGPAPKAGASAR